jgi:hypothetical protein
MSTTDFDVSFKRVNFRTSLLVYRDAEGTAQAYFEQSAVPEFDWIGAEQDFEVSEERLRRILPRIREWAESEGLRLRIWKEHELGV